MEQSIQSENNCSTVDNKIQYVEPAEVVPKLLSDCDAGGWIKLVTQLEFSGVAKALACHCAFERVSGNQIWLVLDHSYDTLFNEMNEKRIATALSQYFTTECVLNIKVGDVVVETPAMQSERYQQELLEEAKRSIYNDKNVKKLISLFSAVVNDASIRPCAE